MRSSFGDKEGRLVSNKGAETMAEPDLLFTVRNSFYLGAFQGAIAEASDLEGLSEGAKVERDSYVYRSYIELGSFEVRTRLESD